MKKKTAKIYNFPLTVEILEKEFNDTHLLKNHFDLVRKWVDDDKKLRYRFIRFKTHFTYEGFIKRLFRQRIRSSELSEFYLKTGDYYQAAPPAKRGDNTHN